MDEIQEKVWEYLEELTERLLHPIHMYLMSLVSKVQENNSEMRISPRPILGELVRFEDFFNFLEKTDSSITVPFRPSFSSSLLNLLSSGKNYYFDFS